MRTICFVLLIFLLNIGVKAQPFNITATIPYNNTYASGTYQIYRSYWSNNITLGSLRKPIVFVEGFDPNSIFSIDYIAQMLYFNSSNLASPSLPRDCIAW